MADTRGLLDRVAPDLRLKIAIEHAIKRNLPLPPLIKAQVLGEIAGERGLTTYNTFTEFIQARNPSLLQFEHVHYVLPALERICRGELTRVLVLWPTQYMKSELFSRLLPAYYLLKHQSRWVGLSSYNAELSWELSAEARDNYAAAGGKFKDGGNVAAAKNWRTARGHGMSGGMWATSIDGKALGKGFHLGIIDDPLDPKQAHSRAYQRRFSMFWQQKWLRALRPLGCLVVVMQRLGVDDPIAFLLNEEQEALGENGVVAPSAHHWHILAYDEIKSNEPFAEFGGPRGFPVTCTVEPDPRKPGDVLSPKWKPPEWVRSIQAQVGPVAAASQRQQRPMMPTGDFWQLAWFEGRVFDEIPKDCHNVGWDWDLAYTKDDANSASSGIRSGRGVGDDKSFPIYVLDVDWDWLEFPELIAWMKDKQGPHYIEAKASGKSASQVLKTHGIATKEIPVIGDKLARASAAQPAASGGRIYISKNVYKKLLYGESQGLLRVTAESLQEGSEGLDTNDTFVQMIWRHLNINSKRKVARFG
jgi:hypothetical protein